MRSTAVYRLRFIAANTTPSSRVGHHCAQVNRRRFGRTTGSSTAAATNWRTATTPAGPIAANACAPTAAPTWLLAALAVTVARPASVAARRPRAGRGGVEDGVEGGVEGDGTPVSAVVVVVMIRVCAPAG